jgi:hypothetical protein
VVDSLRAETPTPPPKRLRPYEADGPTVAWPYQDEDGNADQVFSSWRRNVKAITQIKK